MDIRIGNDIRLNATIRNDRFPVSLVKYIKAYLINTTMVKYYTEHLKDCKKYKRGPFPQFYDSTPYTTHGCGMPLYNVIPVNTVCEYSHCHKDFKDPHWWPQYRGFGINSNPFFEGMPFCYCAPIIMLPEANKVLIYFKAAALRFIGTYKLIICYSVYESGWGYSNLHDYTEDYGEVFNLICGHTDMPDDFIINVQTNRDVVGGTMYYLKTWVPTPSDWSQVIDEETLATFLKENLGSVEPIPFDSGIDKLDIDVSVLPSSAIGILVPKDYKVLKRSLDEYVPFDAGYATNGDSNYNVVIDDIEYSVYGEPNLSAEDMNLRILKK